MNTPPLLALHEYPEDVQLAILWYAELERCAGWLAGYDYAQREFWGAPADDSAAGESLKALALLPSHADVLERRGQHDQAERYREMLRDRGIA